MSIHTIDYCSICCGPLGELYSEYDPEDGITRYVTVDLDTTPSGIVHKTHRICVYEWFQQQIFDEQPGKNPYDLSTTPFSCPLCRERISTDQANESAGVSLTDILQFTRREKVAKLFIALLERHRLLQDFYYAIQLLGN